MEIVTFNTQEKAERCIFALGKRKKDWRKIESQFTDKVEYLVWYEPIKCLILIQQILIRLYYSVQKILQNVFSIMIVTHLIWKLKHL